MMDRMTARVCGGDAAAQDLRGRMQTRCVFVDAEALFSAR